MAGTVNDSDMIFITRTTQQAFASSGTEHFLVS